jgi:hypothetical protein
MCLSEGQPHASPPVSPPHGAPISVVMDISPVAAPVVLHVHDSPTSPPEPKAPHRATPGGGSGGGGAPRRRRLLPRGDTVAPPHAALGAAMQCATAKVRLLR